MSRTVFKSKNLNIKTPMELNKLTKFEKARILAVRAEQLQNGASVIIPEGSKRDEYEKKYMGKSCYEIAIDEFNNGLSPLIIERPNHDGSKKSIKLVTELK